MLFVIVGLGIEPLHKGKGRFRFEDAQGNLTMSMFHGLPVGIFRGSSAS